MFSISDVKAAHEKNPFRCSYDSKLDSLVPLTLNGFELAEDNSSIDELLVPTSNLLLTHSIIHPWLVSREHVMLIGPEASGKR